MKLTVYMPLSGKLEDRLGNPGQGVDMERIWQYSKTPY